MALPKTSYYRRLWQVYRAYKQKKTRLPYPPVRLWVEATSICNLRCVMCPNKDLKKEDKGFMSFDLFRKVIDEASSFVFDVNLIHRGEGLLHPEFPELVKYAKAAGVTTKFHTNATLLDEKKSRDLINAGLDQISFSFDGYDKTTYESIRVNADFDQTIANIVGFLRMKKNLQSSKPRAILELINFPEVYKDTGKQKRKEFLQHFRGLPLDAIEVKEMHNWAGEVPASGKGKKYSPCTFLWQALVIFWDGAVLPCTQDFFGYLVLGDVRKATLLEIWNNDKMVKLREKILDGHVADLKTCGACDRLWRAQFLGVPREYLWKFLLKRMP